MAEPLSGPDRHVRDSRGRPQRQRGDQSRFCSPRTRARPSVPGMRQESVTSVERWWSAVLGLPTDQLWVATTVTPHAPQSPLRTYGGWSVVRGGSGVHVSLPSGTVPPQADLLQRAAGDPGWDAQARERGLRLVGPSRNATPTSTRRHRTPGARPAAPARRSRRLGGVGASGISTPGPTSAWPPCRAAPSWRRATSPLRRRLRRRRARTGAPARTALQRRLTRAVGPAGVRAVVPAADVALSTPRQPCWVTGFHDARVASKAVMSSAWPRVIPTSSRPSSRRHRV